MEPSDTSTLLMTVNVTFNVPLLAVVLAVLAALLLYTGVIRYRRYRLERQAEAAARLIADYFRQHGFEVVARCFSILGGQRFVAVVESPPLKRFRYSHIIESSLILHLQQTAGVTVDKIFWRFPLAWQGSEALPAAGKSVEEDPYFAEHQARLQQTLGSYQIEDASWESYQSSLRKDEGKQA